MWMQHCGEPRTGAGKSQSPDDPFSGCRRAIVETGQSYYLVDTACLVAREDVVFFAFLCFLAVLVAGAVGSVFGASAAIIMGTATAVARRVIAIFFILLLLRRHLLSAFYTPIMRLSGGKFDSPERLWKRTNSLGFCCQIVNEAEPEKANA